MAGKDGQKYLCHLPLEEKTKSGTPLFTQNTTGLITESEKLVKLKKADELLELLKGRCFIRQEGWWSLEFCYHEKIRQFHVEDEKVVQEYILGYHDPEATSAYNENLSDISTMKDPRSKDALQRYHDGTTCDLTSQPQETEVFGLL